MVTKANITKVISPRQVEVFVPKFADIDEYEGEKDVASTLNATVCTIAGSLPTLKKGQTVIVSIEDNNLNNIMVIGLLIKEDKDTGKNQYGVADGLFDNLIVNNEIKLPYNTTIGEISAKEIATLKGLTTNIKDLISNSNNNSQNLLKDLTKILNDYCNS